MSELTPGVFTRKKRGTFQKWQPKKWKPKYEQIVALHCAGFTNIKLAEMFQMTTQQICNIVTSDKANEIKEQAIQAIRSQVTETLPDKLEKLGNKALQVMSEVMSRDDLLKESPFAMFDRAKDIAEGIGNFKTKNSPLAVPPGVNIQVNNQQIAATVSQDEADDLAKSLLLSSKVSQLHQIELQPVPSNEPTK